MALSCPSSREAKYVGRYGWVTASIEDEPASRRRSSGSAESYWLKAPAAVREAAWAGDGD